MILPYCGSSFVCLELSQSFPAPGRGMTNRRNMELGAAAGFGSSWRRPACLQIPASLLLALKWKCMIKSRAGSTSHSLRHGEARQRGGMFSSLPLWVLSPTIIHPFFFPGIFHNSGFCFAFSVSPDVLCNSMSEEDRYIISSHPQ